jgi:hydroxymethylglutaryl-CoA reductase
MMGSVTRQLRLHRYDLDDRRTRLGEAVAFEPPEWEGISCTPGMRELADVMVECAVGVAPLPLGIAEGFLIDGKEVAVPMAVEEPSVIAAASFAGRLVSAAGGFHTWAAEPLMSAQVFLEGVSAEGEARLRSCTARLKAFLAPHLASLERRGGGFRDLQVERLTETGAVRVELLIDVRDAMGANRLTTAAELASPLLEKESGGRTLMAILSNEARDRLAGASCEIPFARLRAGLAPGTDSAEAARRISAAALIAQEDPSRAVAHNKGIMNGISALALATMNDTRAVEAAAHAWAARSGTYRGLSTWQSGPDSLKGRLELPLALASVGGSVDFHPASRACLRILGFPGGPGLSRIAAAVGLAQNLAALLALVTQGIGRSHLRKHAARLAWKAGARGREVRQLADRLWKEGTTEEAAARELLRRLRESAR